MAAVLCGEVMDGAEAISGSARPHRESARWTSTAFSTVASSNGCVGADPVAESAADSAPDAFAPVVCGALLLFSSFTSVREFGGQHGLGLFVAEGGKLLCKAARLKYEFILLEKLNYPIYLLYKVMHVSKSGFYKWLECNDKNHNFDFNLEEEIKKNTYFFKEDIWKTESFIYS